MKNANPSSEKAAAWSYPRRIASSASSPSPRLASSRVKRFEMAIGTPEPGETLAQRFTIQSRLAEGGMSLIYQAFDERRQHSVALKFLSPALLQEPSAIKAFKQEAQISIEINHPNILRVFDVQVNQGSYFLVMELLEGGTLRQWIRSHSSNTESDRRLESCRILLKICKGLEHAHQTTAHCDLKPENIGITSQGDVKIMDFGLAQLTSRAHSSLFRETVTQLNGGTPYYIAPEQLAGQISGNPLCDQFSFGVIAYELLTGELPIGLARPLASRVTDLNPRFTQAIDRCLATDPQERFPDMEKLFHELEQGLASRTSWKLQLTTFWNRRSGPMRALAIIAMTCLCLLLPAKVWLQNQAAKQTEIDSGWHQLDEAMQAAAEVSEIAQEKKRSFQYLQQAFERQTRITNRTVAEQIAFEKLSQERVKAESVWSWFEPQLNSNGAFALLDQLILETRQALRSFDLSRVDQNRLEMSQFLTQIQTQLNQVPRILSLQQRTSQRLSTLPSISANQQQLLHWQQEQATATQIFKEQNWPQAIRDSSRLDQDIEVYLESQFQEASHHFHEQEARWLSLFGELEPPDIRFLSDPFAEAEEALERYPEGQEVHAIRLYRKAANTLSDWTDEIVRHEQALEEAKIPGVEYIDALGMQFAKIGELYWGVTEIRVMDFARWVTDESKTTPTTAKHWIAPGFPQGPTDPAVWITYEDALNCAHWIGHILTFTHFKHPHEGKLPRMEHRQALLETGDLSQRIPLAMYPDQGQWQSNKFQLDYEDKRLDPRRYLGPTDRGKHSRNGLFGLENGVWEWCDSYYDYGNRGPWRHTPQKRTLAGGGNFGIATFNTLSPPRTKDIDFVLRKDAVGFRIILSLHPNP